jgi:hypothetical protein
VQLKSSLRLGALQILMHGLGIGVAWSVALPVWLLALLSTGLLVSGAFYLLRDVFGRLPGSWREIAWQDRHLQVTQRDGRQWLGTPVPGSVVCRHFVALGLRVEMTHRVRWRVIFPDGLTPEEFRRMLVGLMFFPDFQGRSIVGAASAKVSG